MLFKTLFYLLILEELSDFDCGTQNLLLCYFHVLMYSLLSLMCALISKIMTFVLLSLMYALI